MFDGDIARDGLGNRPLPRLGCQPKQRGFTLVELILVMVIAGILAAVAIPRMVGRSSIDARGFTDELASTVRFAQKLAISQRTDVYVLLYDADADADVDATLCYVVTTPCPAGSEAPGPGGEKPYTITAPDGLTIGITTTLQFDASGRTPGLALPLDIPVNGVGGYHVWVEHETGYVHD